MTFSEACHQGFSPGCMVSSPPSLVNCFNQGSKAKINVISKTLELPSSSFVYQFLLATHFFSNDNEQCLPMESVSKV